MRNSATNLAKQVINRLFGITAVLTIVFCSTGLCRASSTVSITSPSNGAVVSGQVTVVAAVGSGVWWAELYIDGQPGPESPPYSFSWNSATVANGSHTLEVAAFAYGGTSPVATATINVTVSNGTQSSSGSSTSTVSITSPSNGATESGEVTIVAAVSSKVWWAELYIDGQSGPTSPPYNFSWNSTTVPNGTHTLEVAAFAYGGTTPIGTSTINVVVANGEQSGAVHFNTLPPHSALPSDSQCAALIATTPETMPGNASYNSSSVIPSSATLTGVHTAPVYGATWVPASDFTRVDGDYSGSTDMILRWTACKWGIDEDVVRAQAWNESGWSQTDVGDWRTTLADCEMGIWNGWTGTGCYQSHGILEVKLFDFNAYPEAITSTAANADFRMAYQRACMNGDISYLSSDTPTSGYPTYPNGTTDQILWGCIGDWYSGDWYDSGALSYIAQVQQYYASKPWLSQ
jgi:Bacterial Ig domain